MNQFLVAAAHKSSGKTTLSIGLAAALGARNKIVQPFKKGPDYIDPLWLGMAAGRPCHNLDFYLSPPAEIHDTYTQRIKDAEVALIEGNKGLYDGLDLDGSNSNAALAMLLDVPVVLVIDAQGMTRGVAPLILGYEAFEPKLRFAGVILNQIRGSRHEAKLRAVIEHYTDLPVLGAVHHDADMVIIERHLGLVPGNESDAAMNKISAIAERVSDEVDIPALLARTEVARPQTTKTPTQKIQKNTLPAVRIGIIQDAAFGFYYPADLEALGSASAELVSIDSIHDTTLPEIDGLFIGGGFPETQAAKLTANRALREAIHESIENNLPVYAECGGLMYLTRGIEWQGERYEMVGAIKADIHMHDRPVGRGYTRLRENGDNPWGLKDKNSDPATFPAHEFHYSSIENLAADTRFAYTVERGMGIDGAHDGILYKNVLASYVHLRDVAGNHWTQRFVDFVRRVKADTSSN